MNPIVLQSAPCRSAIRRVTDWETHTETVLSVPEGVKVIDVPYEYEGTSYVGYRFELPEANRPRYFDCAAVKAGLVLPIGNRRYKIAISIDNDEHVPSSATVMFAETDEPETPSIAWDADEEHAKAIAFCERELAEIDELAVAEGFDENMTAQSKRYTVERLQSLRNGERLHHRFYAQAFGQPTFIQGETCPEFNGRGTMNLITLETGWGDSGNINLLFGLDDEGRPAALYLEASCC